MTDQSGEQPEPQPQPFNIMMTPDQMGGVWANFAMVSHSAHEFTLDFMRVDYNQVPPQGVVVQRINVSPLFITQLMDALSVNWQSYADKAMPKEVQGNGGNDPDGGTPDVDNDGEPG